MKPFSDMLRRSVCILFGLGILLTGSGSAWSAPADGRIVFTSNRDGNNEIYIMDSDGANLQRLTNLPGNDHSPSLSPDGRKLVWASSRQAGAGADIYEMNIDGTNERQLTFDGADEIHPAYSPDGSKVAFSTRFGSSDYDIYLLNLKDMTQKRLTTNSLGDYNPSWSPDGSKIAFKTFYGNTYVPQITVINADGTGQKQLTTEGNNEYPSWNKDNYIAFWSNRGGQVNVYVMTGDGTNQQPLTSSGANRDPAWNPAGNKIAFARNTGADYEIYSLNINGDPPVRLTTNPAQDDTPFWGRSALPDSGKTLSIEDTEVIEGDSGQVIAGFKVKLSGAATVPVSVTYGVAGDTAFAGFDFAKVAGTVFFAAGETEKIIEVPVFGDTSVEGDESFKVNLSNPLGAALSDAQATGTIIDNDSFPTISISSTEVAEGNAGTTDAVLSVSLSAPYIRPVKVDYSTVDSGAIAGADYVANSGTLTFAPGDTEKLINVQVKGDFRFEQDEVLNVALSNPVYAKLIAPPAGPQVFNPANNHWYQLVTNGVYWEDAKNAAAAQSLYGVTGHLATVTSEAEKNFLASRYPSTFYYLGGFQSPGASGPAEGWQWITGEPWDYTFWWPGEPNDLSNVGDENVLHTMAPPTWTSGSWNDAVGTINLPYMIEFDTAATSGLGSRPGTIVIQNDDPGPLPPAQVSITNPASGTVTGLPRISGTALDSTSGGGITQVKLTLKRLADNKYWNGSAWNSDVPVDLDMALTPGLAVNWQRLTGLPSPTAADTATRLTNGNYTVAARATNADGLQLSTTTNFTVNMSAPAVSVTHPPDGAVLN